MPRHLFGPEVVWDTDSNTTPATLTLAPSTPFTVWTHWEVGVGVDVTASLLQVDQVSPLTPLTTADGEIPRFYGPDTTNGAEVGTLYVSADGGSRYPIYADDLLSSRLLSSNTTTPQETADLALALAQSTADDLAALSAIRNMGGVARIWGRTAAQGMPTEAEGLADDDYIFLDVD